MANKDRDILDILYLCSLSNKHCNLPVKEFLRLVLPPVRAHQYLIKRVNGKVVAAATWAFLSDTVCSKYNTRTYDLQYRDWTSGSNFYLVDFFSPLGHTKVFFRELIAHVKFFYGVKRANYYVLNHKRAGTVKL